MTDDLLKRLLQPPFGTETSERNLMAEAAVRILELEAASARARNDALGEAAGCIGHITRHEDLDAIFALRTKPPASVEPVNVQGWQPIQTAPVMCAVLISGGDVLYPIVASRTCCPDEGWWLDAQGAIEGDYAAAFCPTKWMSLDAIAGEKP